MSAAEAADQYNAANGLQPDDADYLVPPRSGTTVIRTSMHELNPVERHALHEAMQFDLIELDQHGHPIVRDFADKYVGTYDTFRDYVIQHAESVGLLDGVSDEVKRYFSWYGYERDMAVGHTVLGAADYRVHVFRDL
ncbi:hypothetical protein AXK61_07520 [Tsukamurella pseudospumae]|uniref:Uncharacterized protein n=2 Tax=Tsukamurella pseudospumae TaxID=239498 RepID=A0A137YWX1_9ACTN|nr:hypothetical protein AXK61_07520 [Tsukamurella pseudospumae]